MIKMYKGYCFFENGTHTEAVHLKTEQEAVSYFALQKGLQHKVRIVDSDDYVILESVDGKITFPPINNRLEIM
jgi:hypothetical protein